MALKSVNQILEAVPGLTPGGIRWDLFNADQNGLEAAGAIIRRGRRILIDEDAYLAWMRGGGAKSRPKCSTPREKDRAEGCPK